MNGCLAADPTTTEGQIEALRHYFLLRYHQEVNRLYPALRGVFPLVDGSRLDLVHVNGGSRTHFLYQRSDEDQHLVVIHDLTAEFGGADEDHERAFVERAVAAQEPVAHFVVLPPYKDRFDEVEAEAIKAVSRHAREQPRFGAA